MQFVALHQAGEKGSCYYGHKREETLRCRVPRWRRRLVSALRYLQYNLMTHRPIFCGLRVTTQRERKATVMWVLFAFGSALFAGLTSVLAKCGIKSPPSALR